MILLSNIDGTLTDVTNEPIYRGASNVNEILLIAPFVKSSVVAIYATLPNGVELPPEFAKATNIPTFAGLYTADGVALNAWVYKLQFAMTQLAGELRLQFAITHTGGTTTTSQIVKQILPGSGFIDPGETGEGFATIQQAVLAAQTAQAAAEAAEDDAVKAEARAMGHATDAQTAAAQAASNATASANSASSAAQSAANSKEWSDTSESAADRASASATTAANGASSASSAASAAAESATSAKGYADSINPSQFLLTTAFNFLKIQQVHWTRTSQNPITIKFSPFGALTDQLCDVSYTKLTDDPNGYADVQISDGVGTISITAAGQAYLTASVGGGTDITINVQFKATLKTL